MDLQGSVIAVTGGTGFLGWHVAGELRRAGAQVLALGSRDFDLRRRHQIDRMLREIRPQGVVHLAASVGGLGANRAEPGRFFYENALMGIELVEACRVAGVDKLLLAGTASSYPKETSVPFAEEDIWRGYPDESIAPYALAKKMLLVQAQ